VVSPPYHPALPVTVDGIVDAVIKVNEGIRGPHPLPQFFPRNQFARLFEQNLQELERLLLQSDPDSVLVQFSGVLVEFERPEANDRM